MTESADGTRPPLIDSMPDLMEHLNRAVMVYTVDVNGAGHVVRASYVTPATAIDLLRQMATAIEQETSDG